MIGQDDPSAGEQLLPLVYDESRRLAATKLDQEKPGQTLQARALVHEAYLRLVGTETPISWDSRGHFFAAAAEAMRRILVEAARRKKRLKRGGDQIRAPIDEAEIAAPEIHEDVLALDETLDKPTRQEPSAAEIVRLRYFAGLTVTDAAHMLQISPRSADRLWAYARAWLHRELRGSKPGNYSAGSSDFDLVDLHLQRNLPVAGLAAGVLAAAHFLHDQLGPLDDGGDFGLDLGPGQLRLAQLQPLVAATGQDPIESDRVPLFHVPIVDLQLLAFFHPNLPAAVHNDRVHVETRLLWIILKSKPIADNVDRHFCSRIRENSGIAVIAPKSFDVGYTRYTVRHPLPWGEGEAVQFNGSA